MILVEKFSFDGIIGIDHNHGMFKGENATIHELVDFIYGIEEVEDVIVVWEKPKFVDSFSLFSFFCVDIFMITNGFVNLFHYTTVGNEGNLNFSTLIGMMHPTSTIGKGKLDMINIKLDIIYIFLLMITLF